MRAIACWPMLLSALLMFPVAATAQDRSVLRLVAPYPAGGNIDVVARIIAQPLSAELGRPVIVDNRAGGSGMIGSAFVARAAPDGGTLLLNTSIQVVLPHLMKLPYDTLNDFTPLAAVNSLPYWLVVAKDSPFRSVDEVVAYAKANPGKLNFASNSTGGGSHLAGEQFKKIAGVDITHIPYKGAPAAIADLMGGQVQIMFEQGPAVGGFVKNGQLRALATTSRQRSAMHPDVPTFAEAGYPAFVYSNWQGIWGPPKMSAEVSERLEHALTKVLQSPAVRQRLLELNTEPLDLTGDKFRNFVLEQYEVNREIVKSANVKLE
ncbi:MAG TPA: tripartite tricarboxylate transporter substrate binding protein [Burkholderiales bacterium]|nr:tripartite tricarboxylate transporter substrate binding protein [Burkholderiales bacterium]